MMSDQVMNVSSLSITADATGRLVCLIEQQQARNSLIIIAKVSSIVIQESSQAA
jgi:hypothetical protein